MNNSDNNTQQTNNYQTNTNNVNNNVVNSNEPTMISNDAFSTGGFNVTPNNTTTPISDVNAATSTTTNVSSNIEVLDSNTFGSNNEGAVVNEKLKEVEINYTPPSKFKIFMMIFLFAFLIAFVFFLPEITSLVNRYKSGQLNYKEEVITTGKLKCTLQSTTEKLTKQYDLVFEFTDSKLDRTKFVITTKGDPSEDEEIMDKLAANCNQLSDNVQNMEGVSIRCKYLDGQLIETQSFELENIDTDSLDAAYTEVGGNYPTYAYGQDIDVIQKNMTAVKYQCTREK